MALFYWCKFRGRGFDRVLWTGNAKPLEARGLAIFANARFGLRVANSLHHKRFHFARGVGVPQVAYKTQNIERPCRRLTLMAHICWPNNSLHVENGLFNARMAGANEPLVATKRGKSTYVPNWAHLHLVAWRFF